MFVNGWFPVGTKLKVKSRLPVFDHYGIAGYPTWAGTQMVIHNMKKQGVVITTLHDFSGGQRVDGVWVPRSFDEGEAVWNRAHTMLGQKYNIATDNCEHFVN